MTDATNPPRSETSEVGFVSLQPGQKVGRYEIVAVLGSGGFGITYRARDTQLHRDVALKEYLPSSLAVRHGGSTVLPRSTDAAEDFTWGRDRFVAEGRTLASLGEAPAIVRVHDFLEANGTAYIVMELVRGETLDRRMRDRGPLTPAEIDTILWPLLEGLSQVHVAGFLHRDIKPANILLSASGKPTLIDFGASRAAMAGRTTALTAIFTPGYAAAEQMTAARQGPWTDIYGLAATLYHAITGAAPPSAFERILEDTYKPLVELAPAGFAAGLLAGIDAGLEVRAADRPQSIEAWRPILSRTAGPAAAATVALPRAKPPAAPQPSAPRRRGGLLRVGAIGAALVVVVAAAGGYFLFANKPANQGTTLQDMKVEDLERALEARRKADAEAAEKRRLEEEAQKKAASDAEAKLAADAALEKAQKERQAAEAELARLKSELEAQKKVAAQQADAQRQAAAEEAHRKAQVEAKAKTEAEEEARRKAAAEAETKRLADEALAKAQAEREKAEAEARAKAEAEAKQKAEADAKQKAAAEAEAKAKADAEAEKKASEASETALRLAVPDRQRLQVALTSLGFDTRGSDGAIGPRTREMIAAWQKARQLPATGFLNASQQQALQREAAAALQKYDDDQKKADEEKKKLEEEKRKAEEEAKAKAAAAAPPQSSPPTPAAGLSAFDGSYAGTFNTPGGPRAVSVVISNGAGTGKLVRPDCGSTDLSFKVSPEGEVSGSVGLFDQTCFARPGVLRGRASNGQVQLTGSAAGGGVASGTLVRGTAPQTVAATPLTTQTASPPGGAFDGNYGGTLTLNKSGGLMAVVSIDLSIAGGSATGKIVSSRCGGSPPVGLAVSPTGQLTGTVTTNDGSPQCNLIPYSASGAVASGVIELELRGPGSSGRGALRKGVAVVAPSPSPSPASAPFDGVYAGSLAGAVAAGAQSGSTFFTANLTIAGSHLSGTVVERRCGSYQLDATVTPSGEIKGQATFPDDGQCVATTATISGRVDGKVLTIEVQTQRGKTKGSLNRSGG